MQNIRTEDDSLIDSEYMQYQKMKIRLNRMSADLDPMLLGIAGNLLESVSVDFDEQSVKKDFTGQGGR